MEITFSTIIASAAVIILSVAMAFAFICRGVAYLNKIKKDEE